MNITLTAHNDTEKRVLAYLTENASEVLAEKINAGKKTLHGALEYAKAEARKTSGNESCVCVDDATVFGWIVHYFEEAEIQEKAPRAVSLPGGVKKATPPPAAKPEPKKVPPKPAADAKHLSMFEALFAKGTKA